LNEIKSGSSLVSRSAASEGNPGAGRGMLRNRRGSAVLPVILAVALLGLAVFFVFYFMQSSKTIADNKTLITSLQEQNASQRIEIDSYKVEVVTLQNENSAYQVQVSDLQTKGKSLETEVASLQGDNTTLQSTVSSYKVRVSTLQDQNSSLQSQTLSLQTQLSQTSTKYDTTSKQLALYQDTYGSLVASGTQPNAERLNLVNSSSASNPTWTQLQNFILTDKTDKTAYVLDSYDCKDFSRDVHNNAEKAGIRAGVALVSFQNQAVGHSCDVFKTSDKGLVFVDCTGPAAGQNPAISHDTTVAVKLGTEYKPVSMFSDPRWVVTWLSMGTVTDVRIYW